MNTADPRHPFLTYEAVKVYADELRTADRARLALDAAATPDFLERLALYTAVLKQIAEPNPSLDGRPSARALAQAALQAETN